jgi:hypothetical protein
MAACETRGFIASQDDYYLCPLPILQLAEGEAAVLRVRVAKAVAAIETFNRRGRGKKRFEEVDELHQAVDAVLEH